MQAKLVHGICIYNSKQMVPDKNGSGQSERIARNLSSFLYIIRQPEAFFQLKVFFHRLIQVKICLPELCDRI